ncbi:ribbon-helix-helix domain-containing protein [Rhizobium hainanense]|uniref:Predicted DNA-binding protein, contains Ribbon-helix-helix (RHH) domain n=1 Tax=Rhizobium hainanense TaxID=52131 RepID=A0A1C3WJK1_9HYPH|nr:ribbon-helix-helix domain-containing protein [Rhizobium hainanense]SCB40213.1 Predicted DNA-binding protein, contains Ribbon-helix-helix (RHH) domain [Rhizobium hainanense]
MCEIYAGQDPESYRPINRSIRIGGHSTSIQLEAAFWILIDEIAKKQGFSTARFLSTLYDEALEINGTISNFSSLLRTSCLIYLLNDSNERSSSSLRMLAAE